MRYTFIIALIAIARTMFCQNVPNAGFENWATVGGWYENPVSWQTNNSQLLVPVTQGSPYAGNFSMQVNNGGQAKTKFQVNQHPAIISCYVKCNIPAGDSVGVKILLYSAGLQADSGKWTSQVTISNWTLKNIAVTTISQVIDSVEIIVKGGTQPGTVINIDEFTFTTTSINEYSFANQSLVYPLPAYDEVTIVLSNPNELYDLWLFDEKGNLQKEIKNVTGNFLTIPAGELRKGTYYYQLSEKKEVKKRGILVME